MILPRWIRSAGIALGLLPGAAAAASAEDLSCTVDLAIGDGRADIHGVAISKAGGQGQYRLVVRKSGSAGTSAINQGGAVVLEPNSPLSVGKISLSLEGGASYEAILTLEVDGIRRECRSSGQAELKL